MIFTEGKISFESSPRVPKYFSTTITNEFGAFTHLHCLITSEAISAEVVHSSLDRIFSASASPLHSLLLCPKFEEQSPGLCYVPVSLCLVTSTSYIDIFREILESIHYFLTDIKQSGAEICDLVSSMEFMRIATMILNDTIVPPHDIQVRIGVGGKDIEVPVESSTGLPHAERCIAVLVDLIDIVNILEIWECLVMNRHVCLMSCNEYLLYLILGAFKELLFPLKWSLYIVPVLGPHLLEIMQSPVPILVGVNSTQVTIEEALQENPNACILDIDSNILHNSNTLLLCHCQKDIISKKLQLIKAYYYVSGSRLSTYRMHNLEKNIDDKEFVDTAKMMIDENPDEKEKIFISLIKNVFLDFFTKGLSSFNKHFSFDTLFEKFEFNHQRFLDSVTKCESCKMGEFWKSFTESSTFQQFLEYEGKHDDSNYKRYFEILSSIRKKDYKIYSSATPYSFDIQKLVSPRFLLQIIKQDVSGKPKGFLRDSINSLRRSIIAELRPYKDYYRCGDSGNKYKPRRHTFTEIARPEIHALYYGTFGIIRLTSLLLARLSPCSFMKISDQKEGVFPKLNVEIGEKDGMWEPLMLKLCYLIKGDKKGWDLREIVATLKKISCFKCSSISLQMIAGVLEVVLSVLSDECYNFCNLEGIVGSLSKMLVKKMMRPLVNAKNEGTDTERAEGSKTERAPMQRFKTTIGEDTPLNTFTRDPIRKFTFHPR